MILCIRLHRVSSIRTQHSRSGRQRKLWCHNAVAGQHINGVSSGWQAAARCAAHEEGRDAPSSFSPQDALGPQGWGKTGAQAATPNAVWAATGGGSHRCRSPHLPAATCQFLLWQLAWRCGRALNHLARPIGGQLLVLSRWCCWCQYWRHVPQLQCRMHKPQPIGAWAMCAEVRTVAWHGMADMHRCMSGGSCAECGCCTERGCQEACCLPRRGGGRGPPACGRQVGGARLFNSRAVGLGKGWPTPG